MNGETTVSRGREEVTIPHLPISTESKQAVFYYGCFGSFVSEKLEVSERRVECVATGRSGRVGDDENVVPVFDGISEM